MLLLTSLPATNPQPKVACHIRAVPVLVGVEPIIRREVKLLPVLKSLVPA